jgi:hypothetical protein
VRRASRPNPKPRRVEGYDKPTYAELLAELAGGHLDAFRSLLLRFPA